MIPKFACYLVTGEVIGYYWARFHCILGKVPTFLEIGFEMLILVNVIQIYLFVTPVPRQFCAFMPKCDYTGILSLSCARLLTGAYCHVISIDKPLQLNGLYWWVLLLFMLSCGFGKCQENVRCSDAQYHYKKHKPRLKKKRFSQFSVEKRVMASQSPDLSRIWHLWDELLHHL